MPHSPTIVAPKPADGWPVGARRLAGDMRAPTLASRLDEAAILIHPLTPVRTVLNLFAGAIGSMVLSWRVALAWMAAAMVVELWCWFSTRLQARGQAVTWRTRGGFAACYVAMAVLWLGLGALFWGTGTTEGHAAGAILIMAIAAIVVLLFHTTPIVFALASAAPPLAALTVIAMANGSGWRQLLPVWFVLGLNMMFVLGRARETPSAQESRRQLNASLRDFELLADNITDLITRVDLNGVYQYVSPSALAVLGYRPEELVGTPMAAILHPGSETELVGAFTRMGSEMKPSGEVSARIRHKDGHWLWMQTTAKIVWENGAPTGVIGVSRDATERMAAETALLEAKLEAESANRAKAEFLANVSHEIRTPMNGVLGALQLLEQENISEEGRNLMRHASDCGRMLSQLLNDVLDFSKIEAGRLDLSPEPMDIGGAFDAVTALLVDQARAKGLDLRCEIIGERLWIDADPVRLRQAMFNLVGNAVKFTAEGHVTARLTISPAAHGRCQVRFEVEDTGIGMTPQAQSHLFERFRQAEGDTARRFGGTGLGLSITKALVTMMGGEMGFASVEGEGSTFWLTFEAREVAQATAEPVEASMLGGVKILLVDDNETNRLIARIMLSRLGASVEEAEDGLTALAAARGAVHDLILMDIQMPHMDGVEATRAIRLLSGDAAQVPIIGLTANVMEHQRTQYFAAGMNGVVAKPISASALLAEIARLMAPEDQVDEIIPTSAA